MPTFSDCALGIVSGLKSPVPSGSNSPGASWRFGVIVTGRSRGVIGERHQVSTSDLLLRLINDPASAAAGDCLPFTSTIPRAITSLI